MDKNYHLLCQLYSFLKDNVSININRDKKFKFFLETSGYDSNYQIPPDSLAVKHNPRWLGYSALHFVVEHQRDENFIELLLSRGADFTLKAGNGYTPLRLAIEGKKDSLMRSALYTRVTDLIPGLDLLLSAHTKSNNATNPSCSDGLSHFHIACLANNVPLARLFLQAGVSLHQNVKETSDLFPGFTPIHFAVRYGDEDLVKLLLTHGADLSRVDGNGFTPLRLLVEKSIVINGTPFGIHRDDAKIEKMLLRIDALINLLINEDSHENASSLDDVGLSLLHVSCVMTDTTLAKRLLKLGAHIDCRVYFNAAMWQGYTPAHFAAHCNPKIFKLLLENGADILAKDAKGLTPLDLFIRRCNPIDVSDALKLHPTLGQIQFENGIKLVEVIGAMEQVNNFAELFSAKDVNSSLPDDSPVWPGYTIVHLAVTLSNSTWYDFDTCVRKCFSLKANLTIRDANGMTALHLAFRLHKKYIVSQILEYILSNGTENCVDNEGLSHLQIACIADNEAVVEKFLKFASDPDLPTRTDLTWPNWNWPTLKTYRAGSTLYHIAAVNNSDKMVNTLAKAGVTMNLLDSDGLTAVHIGFLYHDSKISKWPSVPALLSLSVGDDTNYVAERAGQLSHLHVACYVCNPETVGRLAFYTANVNAPIDRGTMEGPYAKRLAPYAGWTPLHFAAEDSRGKIVNRLVAKGADVCARNAAGLNPLHLALMRQRPHLEIVGLLYRVLKAQGDWRDDFGLTRLHVACIAYDWSEVERLLKAGEDIHMRVDANSSIWPSCTPLHVAFGLRREFVNFIVNMITKAGTRFYEVNPVNDDGLSHFHISCMLGNVHIVKNFIDSGANINESVYPFASEYAGSTPLHLAVRQRRKEVVELLLRCGANWRIEDSRGLTPVHRAAHENPTFLVTFFRNVPVDIQAQNIFEETALGMLLEGYFDYSVFRELLNSGMSIKFIDPPAKKEDIALATWTLDYHDFRAFVERATDVTNVDADGKNVVHCLGSLNFRYSISGMIRTALKVKLWLDRGCDLNLRDKNGRTPLHDAAGSSVAGVDVLLLLGADVNVRDKEGRTAFSYVKDEEVRICFLSHLSMMSCCGLDLDDSLREIVMSESFNESEFRRDCNKDLAKMAGIRVADDLSLRDLLTETMVKNFPHFHASKRNDILEFLKTERLFEHCKEWGNRNNIFQFQYRKILRRMKLLEPARMSFYVGVYQLPFECIEFILRNLSNDDLESLINI